MRALVQRADGAAVSIHGEVTGSFDGPGLVVLVGVTHTDTPELAARLAAKVWGARLFDRDRLPSVCVPPGGPAELSASDVGLPLLDDLGLDTDEAHLRRDAPHEPGHAEQLIHAAPVRRRGLGRASDARIDVVNSPRRWRIATR